MRGEVDMNGKKTSAVVLGALSVACGAALVVAPGPTTRFFGVPRWSGRLLGVRDIAIGIALLARPGSPVPFLARGISDATDGLLILHEGISGRRGRTLTALRTAGAFSLAAFSLSRARR